MVNANVAVTITIDTAHERSSRTVRFQARAGDDEHDVLQRADRALMELHAVLVQHGVLTS